MNTFKKMICILTVVAISATPILPASAAIKDELEIEVASCVETKDIAHIMADCARKLGFDESSEIIKSAQSKWWDAHTRQLELEQQIKDLESQPQSSLPPTTWTGRKLTRSAGRINGPTGPETYYNLNMSGVVNIMRRMGYDATTYPYWVRSDGCKMLGDYIMVAANLQHFPRGSVVECSLGWAIVCDTGHLSWNQLDIAVTW